MQRYSGNGGCYFLMLMGFSLLTLLGNTFVLQPFVVLWQQQQQQQQQQEQQQEQQQPPNSHSYTTRVRKIFRFVKRIGRRYRKRFLPKSFLSSYEHIFPTPSMAPTTRKCDIGFNHYYIQISNDVNINNNWLVCNVSAGIDSDCDPIYLYGNQKFVVMLEDNGPCTGYGESRGDIVTYGGHKGSGGEFMFCARVAELFLKLHYHMIFIPSITCGIELYEHYIQQNKSRIVIIHGGWEKIPSNFINGRYVPNKPFSDQCTLKIDCFGSPGTDGFWPGDVTRFLTYYPVNNNTYLGGKFELCERKDLLPSGQPARKESSVVLSVDPNTRTLTIGNQGESYVVVNGKWHEYGHVHHIFPMFRNGHLLDYVTNYTNLVLLNCPNQFFNVTQTSRTNGKYICLEENSYWRTKDWRSLIKNAQFVLGLGVPGHTPTPIEALSCLVPVIIPFEQHRYLDRFATIPSTFLIRNEKEFIHAVDQLLRYKNITKAMIEESSRSNMKDLIYDRIPALYSIVQDVEKSCANQLSVWNDRNNNINQTVIESNTIPPEK